MAISFKKCMEDIYEPLVKAGRIKELTKPIEELVDFFNSKDLTVLVDKLPADSAEKTIANFIVSGVVNAPKAGKTARVIKVKEFVSVEQEQHYKLYLAVTEKTKTFWKTLPEYAKLVAIKRDCVRTRKGEEEIIELAIQPTVYMTDAKAVIKSYEVA